MTPKMKVAVTVFLTEDDQIGVQTSSKNKVTNLGLLEMGKMAVMQGSHEAVEEETIIKPRFQ